MPFFKQGVKRSSKQFVENNKPTLALVKNYKAVPLSRPMQSDMAVKVLPQHRSLVFSRHERAPIKGTPTITGTGIKNHMKFSDSRFRVESAES